MMQKHSCHTDEVGDVVIDCGFLEVFDGYEETEFGRVLKTKVIVTRWKSEICGYDDRFVDPQCEGCKRRG